MGIINNGRNKIRDLVTDNLNEAELGTDGTDFVATQTGLLSADATTQTTPTITKSERSFSVSYLKPSTIGAGTTYKEAVVKFNDDTVLSRTVYPDYNATNSNNLRIIETYRIV